MVADTLANEARLTPAVRGGDTVNPSGEADGSSASGGNDELNQTNGNPRVVNGQQRVRRPSVVEVVATAKLRGVDHDDDEEKVGTGSVGGSGQEGSAHEVTYDEALETARQQVLAHLSPDSVQELTKADNPDKPTALLAGMVSCTDRVAWLCVRVVACVVCEPTPRLTTHVGGLFSCACCTTCRHQRGQQLASLFDGRRSARSVSPCNPTPSRNAPEGSSATSSACTTRGVPARAVPRFVVCALCPCPGGLARART